VVGSGRTYAAKRGHSMLTELLSLVLLAFVDEKWESCEDGKFLAMDKGFAD